MRDHYEAWWAGVAPTLEDFVPVVIGSDQENPVTLSAADWANVYCDNMNDLRTGKPANGPWYVIAEQRRHLRDRAATLAEGGRRRHRRRRAGVQGRRRRPPRRQGAAHRQGAAEARRRRRDEARGPGRQGGHLHRPPQGRHEDPLADVVLRRRRPRAVRGYFTYVERK